ncbi:MAG: hypothetical protein QOJ03_1759, partial [Frankiaceae bacterium]|nr:hypothetical protein [Frankiaceae bacterium]
MTVDFDLHGRVLVRLLDAPAAAVSAVTADTGIRPGPATAAAPTITVEFTDDLHLAEPVRRVGRTSGFAGSQFVVGDSPGRRCVVALGTSADFTLRAERAVRHVPHLLALVNIAMLRAGALPLHAAALLTPGGGLVVTGWSKGGKTETVLGLMSRGATFVADEWCYLDPVQRVVLGLRHPIRVWDWQLAQLPVLRAKLTTKQRARLAVTSRVTGPSGLRSRTLRTMLEPTRGVTM